MDVDANFFSSLIIKVIMNTAVSEKSRTQLMTAITTAITLSHYAKIVRMNKPGTYFAVWPNVEDITSHVQWELIDPEPFSYTKIFGSYKLLDLPPVAKSRKRSILNLEALQKITILCLTQAETALKEQVVIDIHGVKHQLKTEYDRTFGKSHVAVELVETGALVKPSFVITPMGLPDIWLYHAYHVCWAINFIKGHNLWYDGRKVKQVIESGTPTCGKPALSILFS